MVCAFANDVGKFANHLGGLVWSKALVLNRDVSVHRMSNPSLPSQGVNVNAEDNHGPALLGVIAAFTAVATIAVGLRLLVRLWIVKSPGLDDGSIVLSLVSRFLATRFERSLDPIGLTKVRY